MSPPSPPIGSLFSPASIAVVGASPRSFVGKVLCANLRSLGYGGDVYPVNPRHQEVLGWRCYPSVDELPGPPEAVVTAVPIELVAETLRAAAKKGARAAVVPGGGFTETGPLALRVQEEIVAVAAEYDLAVAGPNCMGVIAPGRRSAMYIGTVPPTLLPGRVAVVSQSGSIVEAMVNMGPRVGFSALVSCGNEAATTVGSYLGYFAEDEETFAVALFVEGFRDPQGFLEGARALRAAGKPLAVLQAGRSKEAAPAIAAHSGTLAGTDEVVTGMLHQLGAIGVDDLDELIEVAELLGHGQLPAGRRLFVVTDSGGEANLIGDHARALDLQLPAPSDGMTAAMKDRWPNFSYVGNPVDPWGVDPDFETLYREIFRHAVKEDVDVVAMALDKVTDWSGENEVELGLATAEALISAAAGTDRLPVYFTVHATGPAAEPIRHRLRAAQVPLLHGLRPAMVALRRAWWWRQWRPRTPLPPVPPVPITYGEPGPVLSESASREVLAAYGIPLVESRLAATPDEAERAADELGYPAVVKASAPGLAHKAAAGLVATGVVTGRDVRDAFVRLEERASEAGLGFDGALVQATAKGVELIAGMRRDPAFGPTVLLGVGGTLAEVVKEVSVRPCPLSEEDLAEMPDESAVGRLLAAVGADPRPALDVVSALSRLAVDHTEIAEIDVNPLFVSPEGAMGADALVVLDDGAMDREEGSR